MRVFTAPIREVTPDDIGELCREQYPEGSRVEFKRDLPTKKDQPDLWMEGAKQIGPRARNEILEEVIAFANTHGGHVIIGIKETDDKPSCADQPNPLPRCHDLAEKLRLQARDCIEPQLPTIQSWGVPLEDDGSGVVLIRVQESRLAPHRLNVKGVSRECYFRRNDRTEKMTMREIQDLTLNRERGSERLESAFRTFGQGFRKKAEHFRTQDPQSPSVGMRISLFPLSSEVWNDQLYRPSLHPLRTSFSFRMDGENSEAGFPDFDHRNKHERRILRGFSASNTYRDVCELVQATYCDGAVDFVFLEKCPQLEKRHLICLVCNGIITAHNLRIKAGVPESQYAGEIELVSGMGGLRLHGRPLSHSPLIFPRYILGPEESFGEVMDLFYNDLLDASGSEKREPSSLEIGWSELLSTLREPHPLTQRASQSKSAPTER